MKKNTNKIVEKKDEIIDLRETLDESNHSNKVEIADEINMENEIPNVEIKDDKIKIEEDISTEKPIKVLSKKEKFAKFLNLKEKTEKPEITEDAKKSRKYAWLAYVLFFIPLCINSKNSFVRFHANEGLELNIVDTVALILVLIGSLIRPSTVLTVLCVVIGIGLWVLTLLTKIIMIVKTAKGIKQETPWFFRWKIIN